MQIYSEHLYDGWDSNQSSQFLLPPFALHKNQKNCAQSVSLTEEHKFIHPWGLFPPEYSTTLFHWSKM